MELEEQRNQMRKRIGRITYDCFNLKEKEDRAICAKKHHLGRAKNGTLSLLAVLQGVTSGVCKDCTDFEGGE